MVSVIRRYGPPSSVKSGNPKLGSQRINAKPGRCQIQLSGHVVSYLARSFVVHHSILCTSFAPELGEGIFLGEASTFKYSKLAAESCAGLRVYGYITHWNFTKAFLRGVARTYSRIQVSDRTVLAELGRGKTSQSSFFLKKLFILI